jgi:hypothetical protein
MNRLGNRRCRARRSQPESPMRPCGVVVVDVHGKHPAEVSLAEDQHPVGEFGPDRQDEAFGEAVGPRTPGRDLDHFYAHVGKHRVERCRELSRAIADEEPELGGTFAEFMTKLRACCVVQGPSGCPVTPSTCT